MILRKIIFERTSFPQTAPLGVVPLNLLVVAFDVAFFPALVQQLESESFRKREHQLLDGRHLATSNIDWITAILAPVFDPVNTMAPASQLRESYRTQGFNKLPIQYYFMPEVSWITSAAIINKTFYMPIPRRRRR